MNTADNMPIITGVGQKTWRNADTTRMPKGVMHSFRKMATVGARTLI